MAFHALTSFVMAKKPFLPYSDKSLIQIKCHSSPLSNTVDPCRVSLKKVTDTGCCVCLRRWPADHLTDISNMVSLAESGSVWFVAHPKAETVG